MSGQPDADDAAPILPRVAAGEEAAVEEFVDRHGGLVWSLARRLVAGIEDAEDAVQDIFAEIWKSAGRFDPALSSERTFVAMVARRRLIDRRRKLARARPVEPLLGPDTVSDAAETACVSTREEVAIAERLLGTLAEPRRQTLELAISEGRSHQEISKLLGLPLGTVKTHIRRGLIELRELMSRAGVGQPESDS